MKIIIAGYGFVGKAVANSLKLKNEIAIVDPQYNQDAVADHYDADGIIVCVGTMRKEASLSEADLQKEKVR